ncbi:hypothetical protein PoB_005159500 [Plakobranchus ocellatus]|uniref:Uncharacterized protein n=1 Tax=Plakobranchus ocellatus TaxID=259542 RepID=A0AAV4BXE7_9GAST|nr:hypothetical protein PoB_005159500 [Plakobranchus ocellatus]
MLYAALESFHGRHYDPVLKGKRDTQSASSVRCSTKLKQNEFQAEEVSKLVPIRKGKSYEYVCFKAVKIYQASVKSPSRALEDEMVQFIPERHQACI